MRELEHFAPQFPWSAYLAAGGIAPNSPAGDWSDGLTRRVVLSNPHSPSAYRVNGPLRNDDGWYAAFPQIKDGDAYYLAPAQRVSLW